MIRYYKHSVIAEQEDYIVVNKPPHLAVIPERNPGGRPCLKAILERTYGKLYVVHRLDKETSGVMIFCRNADAHRAFSMLFQSRSIEKIYHAVVYGRPHEDEGIMDFNISSQPNSSGKYYVSRSGKSAQTEYKIMEELLNNYYLLQLKIITGRTHQIRVHCQHQGFPLAVDGLYGYQDEFYLSSVKRNFRLAKFEEEIPLMSRTSLHAKTIAFQDPISCEEVRYEAPHFKDFKAVLNQLMVF